MIPQDRLHALANMISSGMHDDTPELRSWASTEAATSTLQSWLHFRRRPSATEYFAVDLRNEATAERDAEDLNTSLRGE